MSRNKRRRLDQARNRTLTSAYFHWWFYLADSINSLDTSPKLVYDTLLSDIGNTKPLAKPKKCKWE
jgi:hypothetical protein